MEILDLEKVKKGEIKDLREANLWGADLWGADLRRADLRGADLGGAYLWNADLRGAYLWNANLSEAYLSEADLRGANLWRANLWGAKLRNADLLGAKLPDYKICPAGGSFFAWKKLQNSIICKLKIPAYARRTSSLVGRKCRAEFAIVEYMEKNGKLFKGVAYSKHDGTEYKVGKIMKPDQYDPDIRVECSHGIHFLISYEEALNY